MKTSPSPFSTQWLPHHNPYRCGHSYAIHDARNVCIAVVGEVDALTDGDEAAANATMLAAAPILQQAALLAADVIGDILGSNLIDRQELFAALETIEVAISRSQARMLP